MSPTPPTAPRTPAALYALTVGSFGIGTTEFVIMGLLLQISADLQVSLTAAGLLISGYALGVFVGAPLLTAATTRLPRKTALVALMLIFTIGNLACALAPNYALLMAARVVTSLAHGTFFGVGAVVATSLVPADRKASAISTMFTGLTVATLLGVPAGAWLGLHFGWRSTFWAVAAIGVLATLVILRFVPASRENDAPAAGMRSQLAVLGRTQVLLALAATVFGFGGVFAVFTYIQPILTQVTGVSEAAVSAILLVFGVGMIGGNMLGGRLADRALVPALLGTLAALAVVLVLMGWAVTAPVPAVIFVGLLGGAAFATVSPLQLRVLQQATGGESLASSLNIAAFNLGNALGAWLGGAAIAHGAGLASLPPIAAALTAAGGAIAWLGVRLERRAPHGARSLAPNANC
ncbi:MFS transporter [Caldimonas sp. KR1-144]|uniref:MFS transporter n=1 Tax=Caldimonas sp. KR1-144 TaxID=3400911 RepID=UPI003C09ABFA